MANLMTEEHYAELNKASNVLCNYCEADDCECCKVTKLMDDAEVEIQAVRDKEEAEEDEED